VSRNNAKAKNETKKLIEYLKIKIMKKSVLNTALFSLFITTGAIAQYKGDNYLTTMDSNGPTCSNTNNGWITINTNPDAGPQTILWNTNDTTMSLSNLGPGTYTFTLTNSFGQSVTDSIVLAAPPTLDIQAEIVNPTSSTAQNGSIILSNVMGTGYSYNWATSNGTGLDVNSFDQLSLGIGSYKLMVENAAGCITTRDFNLIATTPVYNNPATGISGTGGIYINNQNHNILAGSSPFKGKAHITTGADTESVEIYNQRGEQVKINGLEMNNSLQTVDLESGIYIVKFNFLDGTKQSRTLMVD
jgi:hypothetical protein